MSRRKLAPPCIDAVSGATERTCPRSIGVVAHGYADVEGRTTQDVKIFQSALSPKAAKNHYLSEFQHYLGSSPILVIDEREISCAAPVCHVVAVKHRRQAAVDPCVRRRPGRDSLAPALTPSWDTRRQTDATLLAVRVATWPRPGPVSAPVRLPPGLGPHGAPAGSGG